MQDYVTRLVVIWLPVSVFWRATEEVVLSITGRHQRGMLLYGYVVVVVMMTAGRHLVQTVIVRSSNQNFRLVVEELYVGTSAVVSIVLWTGKDLVRQAVIIGWQSRLV